MKQVFFAMPTLDGHRQIYTREFCDYFLSRGLSVTVATRLSMLGEYGELEALASNPGVRFVADTWSSLRGAVNRLRELARVTQAVDPDVTFLPESDVCRGMLTAQLYHPSLRLPGRRVGLFIRSPKYIHETHPSWRLRLFFEVVAQRLPVIEGVLALDEVFVAKNRGRYVWMPDIAEWSGESLGPNEESTAWQGRIAEFLATRAEKPVVVYVGMPQERRKYERLLELARDVDGSFIHCGSLHDPSGYPEQVPAVQRELAARGAILESGSFYQSFETARVTVEAARCVVLPYGADHLTSSGAMQQALIAGRPVLVTDQGLMGWRVRNFGLGMTYRPDDWRDMREKFMALQGAAPGAYSKSIEHYLGYFSREQWRAAVDVAMGFSDRGPRIPARPDGTAAVDAPAAPAGRSSAAAL